MEVYTNLLQREFCLDLSFSKFWRNTFQYLWEMMRISSIENFQGSARNGNIFFAIIIESYQLFLVISEKDNMTSV